MTKKKKKSDGSLNEALFLTREVFGFYLKDNRAGSNTIAIFIR